MKKEKPILEKEIDRGDPADLLSCCPSLDGGSVMTDEAKEAEAVFRRLCSGSLADRTKALAVLREVGLVVLTDDPASGGAYLDYPNPNHPFVKIFRTTSPKKN